MAYTIFMWAVAAVATIIAGSALIVLMPVARFGAVYGRVARAWAHTIIALSGCGLTVRERERIKPGAPYVFVSNHQSYFDVICLSSALPVNTRFVAKRELLFIPVFGLAMWVSGHVIVDRGRPEKAVASMRRAAAKVRKGTSILVFPEGTRSADHRLAPFKKGGFLLAAEAGVPIVPIAISGSSPMMPKGKFTFRRTEVTIVIGEPIPTEGLGPDHIPRLMESTRAAIISLFPGDSPEAQANQTAK